MATIERFEDLEIWRLARKLANDIYQLYTSSGGFLKDYKLKDQINDSSGSVMDNIAEGFERNSRNEFIQFLTISKGSLGEVKSQLFRALDRKHIGQHAFDNLYLESEALAYKIGGLINYLNKSKIKGNKFKNRINPKR